MTRNRPITLAIASLLLAVACGDIDPRSEEEDGGTSPPSESDDFYPFSVGNSWTYTETDLTGTLLATLTYDVTGTTTDTFGELGEREVFTMLNTVVDDENLDDDEERIQYIWDNGTRAERLKHEIFTYDALGGALTLTKVRTWEPGFLRFDRSRLTVGETWSETLTRFSDSMDVTAITEETVTYDYEIMAMEETIQVAAGEFSCIKIKRLSSADSETKYYWFAKGVGKVRETDDLTTEELTSYTVN